MTKKVWKKDKTKMKGESLKQIHEGYWLFGQWRTKCERKIITRVKWIKICDKGRNCKKKNSWSSNLQNNFTLNSDKKSKKIDK